MEAVLKILISLFLSLFCILLAYLYNLSWRTPQRIRKRLQQQGIGGPPPSFLYGNIPDMKRISASAVKEPPRGAEGHLVHDYASSLFPYFRRWREDYGPVYMYSTGNILLMYVSDPDLLKELSLCKSLDLGKPTYMQRERGPLFGNGILASSGPLWFHQRKIIAPELFMDKVKGMIHLMVESTLPLLEAWESRVESEGGVADITVDEDLRSFSADVISRACFGSSYVKGKKMFLILRALQQIMSEKSLLIGVPGSRYLPTKSNREIWRLEKEIWSLICKVVQEREKATSVEKDLLQTIIEGAKSSNVETVTADQFIVDNCKNIYFAGHDTTAVTATWSLMLLASNPDWQVRARKEVAEVCGDRLPDAEMVRKMKTLTMVIQETLRLYPPAAFVSRETFQDMKIGGIQIPKGVNIWIPVSIIHHDPELWGADAHEFNPERFSNGISGACKPHHMYIPFGIGTRTCAGQNFAMVELKVVLSLILSRFSFSLSPKYCHSPAFRLTVTPEHGVGLLVKKI